MTSGRGAGGRAKGQRGGYSEWAPLASSRWQREARSGHRLAAAAIAYSIAYPTLSNPSPPFQVHAPLTLQDPRVPICRPECQPHATEPSSPQHTLGQGWV